MCHRRRRAHRGFDSRQRALRNATQPQEECGDEWTFQREADVSFGGNNTSHTKFPRNLRRTNSGCTLVWFITRARGSNHGMGENAVHVRKRSNKCTESSRERV